jgi:uncharacterized protein YdaU (DUF1376 family)
MKTIPKNDQLTQASERAVREDYEKFVQAGIDHWHKKRVAKEQKDKATEKQAESDTDN